MRIRTAKQAYSIRVGIVAGRIVGRVAARYDAPEMIDSIKGLRRGLETTTYQRVAIDEYMLRQLTKAVL